MKTRVALRLVLVAAMLTAASLITAARAEDAGLPVHNITTGTDYATIQEAINAAVGGDEIEVDPGTYVERINMLGEAITLRSVDGAATTIIDGSDGGTVVTCGSGEGSDTVLRGFTITGGRAGDGGGMSITGSGPTVVDCIFQGNRATDSSDSRGAGMYIHQGSPLVMGCTFIDNTVGEGSVITAYGGGAFLSDSNAAVLDCVFAGNSAVANLFGTDAVARGGGIYSIGGDSTVINTTFSGNSAWAASLFPGSVHAYGGGIASEAGALTVTNCTFAGNSASVISQLNAWGGGVYASGGTTTVTNCVFHANTAHVDPQDLYGSASVSYSCLQDAHAGTGNIVADPLLVDADGPDNTYGTADDDLHLLIASPCIDAGDDTALPADTFDQDNDGDHSESLPHDFEGDPRIADADGDSAPTVDMGADEHWIDCNDNGKHDVRDLAEGTSQDCDANDVLDECDIADGTSPDANGNGIPDGCEHIQNITQGTWHTTIQLAIDSASDGDEIQVGPGTFHERINMRGKAVTLRSVAGPETTLIDGDDGGTVVTCNSSEVPETVIDGFTITNGHAPNGGGMYIRNASPTVRDCTFTANNATTGGTGGGMYIQDGSPTLINCTFVGNWARNGGGLNTWNAANSTFINCGFYGNLAAGGSGGGVLNGSNGAATLINCVISGNSASGSTARGGGLHNTGNVDLTNCTFRGNSAGDKGGAVTSSVSMTMTNSVLWDNAAPEDPGIWIQGGAIDVIHSLVQGAWSGIGNITADPMFEDADGADNVAGTLDDDLRLMATVSPCIDAGDNAAVPADVLDLDGDGDVDEPIPFDVAGALRFVDDPARPDTGSGVATIVDIGAHESQAPITTGLADLDGDGDVDLLDFSSFQAQFTGPQ